MKIKNNGALVNQKRIGLLYQKVLERFQDYSTRNKLSIKSCRQCLSWDFKLRKDEANQVIREMEKLSLIELRSNNTILLNCNRRYRNR